ncbi:hypothetical protein [Chitinophaga arvensicola]|nr:hypothetical protein [Chitinophaga arvensicola]
MWRFIAIFTLMATITASASAQRKAFQSDSAKAEELRRLRRQFPLQKGEIFDSWGQKVQIICVLPEKDMENIDSLKHLTRTRYQQYLAPNKELLKEDTFSICYFGKLTGKNRQEYHYWRGKQVFEGVDRYAKDTILPPFIPLHEVLSQAPYCFYVRHPSRDTIAFYMVVANPDMAYAKKYGLLEASFNTQKYLLPYLFHYKGIIIYYMSSPYHLAYPVGFPITDLLELAFSSLIQETLHVIDEVHQ